MSISIAKFYIISSKKNSFVTNFLNAVTWETWLNLSRSVKKRYFMTPFEPFVAEINKKNETARFKKLINCTSNLRDETLDNTLFE